MKKLILPLVAALALAHASASEYVVLSQNNTTVAVQPTDIVQVVGILGGSGSRMMEFTLASGGQKPKLYIPGGQTTDINQKNVILTGVTQVYLPPYGTPEGDGLVVTLRITKKAEEMASQPVLLPAVPDGRFDVSIETSVDAENWAPAAPGEYLGSSSHRFFRVKAVRQETPPPASGE